MFAGAALAVRGDVERGLSEMLPALDEHRAVVGSHITDIMLALIASADGRAQQWDAGLRQVEAGIALSEETRERVYAAELWRIKGELLLGKARGTSKRQKALIDAQLDASQQCLRRALKIARGQEARSLELRCAMSLVRLSRWSSGSHHALTQLSALVASFAEGLDSKDLRDARALLDDPDQGPRGTRRKPGSRSESRS